MFPVFTVKGRSHLSPTFVIYLVCSIFSSTISYFLCINLHHTFGERTDGGLGTANGHIIPESGQLTEQGLLHGTVFAFSILACVARSISTSRPAPPRASMPSRSSLAFSTRLRKEVGRPRSLHRGHNVSMSPVNLGTPAIRRQFYSTVKKAGSLPCYVG